MYFHYYLWHPEHKNGSHNKIIIIILKNSIVTMKTLFKVTVYTLKGHPYPKKRRHKGNPQDKHE